MKKWMLLLLIILMPSLVSAEFISYNITFSPLQNSMSEEVSIKFVPEGDRDRVTYRIGDDTSNVIASSGPNSEFSVENGEITIYDDFEEGEESVIDISLTTASLVEKSDGTNIFSFRFRPPERIRELNVKFILPPGYVTSNIEPFVSPRPNEIDSDGRNINFEWVFTNVDEELNFLLLYEESSSSNLWIWASIILFLSLIGFYVYHKKSHKEVKKTMTRTLTPDEKTVVNILSDAGMMTQKEMGYQTGFSKSKLSKIVRRLEEKHVVNKEPYMTTNKLSLKKEFKK